MSWPKLSLLEIFLIQFIGWFGLWLANEFTGLLLTSIVASIVFAVLVIARISEGIEPSKVPRRYFQVMLVTFFAPVLAAGIYYLMTKYY
jgi:hypothetical protein